MSYCRIGDDSDVYVIRSNAYEIYLKQPTTEPCHWTCKDARGTLDKLMLMKLAGYKVPERATQRLAREIIG